MTKALSQTVSEIIAESGMSCRKIAEISNIPESTIRKIMHGETEDPRYSTVRAIILACGGSIDRLLGLPPQEIPAEISKYDAAPPEKCAHLPELDDALSEYNGEPIMNCAGYERALKYIKAEAAAAHAANEQIRLQNTELVKSNTLLREQDVQTRARNRMLYTLLIIFGIIAAASLTVAILYLRYDAITPGFGFWA